MITSLIHLRNTFSKYPLVEKLIISLKRKRGDFVDQEYLNYINSAQPVLSNELSTRNIKIGLVKDIHNYGTNIQKRAHWLKYERFLKNNSIEFSFIDIKLSNWIEQVKQIDLLIFRPDISPSAMHDAESKIYFTEKYLKIKCFPSYNELWLYEEKIRAFYLFSHFNIPHVPTFVSNDKNEIQQFIEKTTFPKVSKISSGSASKGVKLLKNKSQAIKFTNYIFAQGAKTYWSDHKQKDYIYLQDYVDDALFDLRIIIVGNKAFGYYRMRPKNDFRASGAGIYEKRELPDEALKIAINVKTALNTTVLAVDLIKRESNGEYLVIEASIFFDVDSPEQLLVDNIPGFYEISFDKAHPIFTFKSGKYWIQELILQEFLNQNMKQN